MQGFATNAPPERTRTDWATPEVALRCVYEAFPTGVDLDPCSNAHSIVKARRKIMLPEDGLTADWGNAQTIFCNPPYGIANGEAAFVERCGFECRENGREAIVLVPAKTDVAYWHESVWWDADAICFWRGRLKFILPGGKNDPAKYPVAFIYFGHRRDTFGNAFAHQGKIVVL